MAWTDPHDWTTNEVVTAALLDTHLKDNMLAVPHPVHTENTTITVTNSALQVSLFSTPPVIAGNALGANGRLHALVWGGFVNNTTTRTLTVRVKYGGVTHLTPTLTAPAVADAATLAYKLEAEVINLGATNVQHVVLVLSGTAPNNAGGDFDEGAQLFVHQFVAGAVDTTANQTFDLSIQWSAADTNTTWTKIASRVMLLQG